MAFAKLWKQSYFIPPPELTEKTLPDQSGRVFIVTGGYAGCGYELCKILYQRHGVVYVAGRSQSKAEEAIEKITQNAGVMRPPTGSKAKQGHELQMTTNCLGPFLLTKLLTPLLKKTASLPDTPSGSVRVTCAASLGVDVHSPPGGVTLNDEGDYVSDPTGNNDRNYGATKAGNYFLASQFARRHANGGLVANAWNPGNLYTELQRHMGFVARWLSRTLLHAPRFGAYTELGAGWSEEAGKKEHNGGYVWPWGRFGDVREDVAN